MTTDDLPICPWCRNVMKLATGCDATEAAHTVPHDGHGCDAPCRDCGAYPGEQHHPGCCVADCVDGQALMCDCELCDSANERYWMEVAGEWIGSHPLWRELGGEA